MEHIDCAVIGAGVIGLAAARALARAGHEVVVLEAAEAIGTGTSSRHSEVIHAGIYYPAGSLKARLCVAGRDALYAYCADRGIPHRRCGKLIVAADEAQAATLADLERRAEANGVTDLRRLSAADARALEPELACAGALLSPSTGILDSHAFMLALQGEAEAAGAAVALLTPVEGGRAEEDGIVLRVGGAAPMALRCRRVVNAAGLRAQHLARAIEGVPAASVPPCRYAKGSYYVLTGRAPFARLVYPVPEPGGLGVHVTIDMGGQCRFGPDVEWVETPDYDVDPTRADGVYAAVRRYWPGLPDGAIQPGYAGVRPKVVGPGEPPGDFIVQGPRDHGVPGLVNLYGIESPGLTASLAIAERVAALLAAN